MCQNHVLDYKGRDSSLENTKDARLSGLCVCVCVYIVSTYVPRHTKSIWEC